METLQGVQASLVGQTNMFQTFLTALQPLLAAMAVNASAPTSVHGSAPFVGIPPPPAPQPAPSSFASNPAPHVYSSMFTPPAGVFKPLEIPKPQPFDGSEYRGNKLDLALQGWLSSIQRIMVSANIPLDSQMAPHYASLFLTGHARAWWDDYCDRHDRIRRMPFSNFHEFASAITAPSSMGAFDPSFDARETVHNMKQYTSVQEYTARYRAAIRHLPERNPADHLHYYIRGLKTHIQQIVLPHHPDNLDDAIALAEQGDRVYQITRSSGRPAARLPHRLPPPRQSSQGPVPMDLNATTSAASFSKTPHPRNASRSPSFRGRSPSRVTFKPTATHSRSRSPSHSPSRPTRLAPLTEQERSRCLKESACFRCRKVGHWAKDCPGTRIGLQKN